MRDLSMHTIEIVPRPVWFLVALVLILLPLRASAFRLDNRWTNTATPGDFATQGSPAIVTWSLVPDGTAIPGKPWQRPTESSDPSNLISFFDGLYGNGGDPALADRPWFPIFQNATDRWSALSGLSFVYEPNDDGAGLYTTIFNSTTIDGPGGVLGVRGDVRIGGHYIDGEVGANTLAYNAYPNAGEMVLDTSNVAFFGNAASGSRAARNVIMHELGHAIGIRHMESSSAAFLMEPNISSAFDGPQLDDILAVHRWYGDVYEKSNSMAGNDSVANATPLGAFGPEGILSIGTDAATAFVGHDAIDFVSIDDETDVDFYRFSLSHPGIVSVTLIPRGPSYSEGPEGGTQTNFSSFSQSNLSLAIYDGAETEELAQVDAFGPGSSEVLELTLTGAGDYYLKVAGAQNTVQLYELSVDFSFLPGDVNLDGILDLSGDPLRDDLLAFVAGWKTVQPEDDYATAWMKGDLNLDGYSDLRDAFLMRGALLDAGAGHLAGKLFSIDAQSVPEPTSLVFAVLSTAYGIYWHRRRPRC
jgi:hypothetical protein